MQKRIMMVLLTLLLVLGMTVAAAAENQEEFITRLDFTKKIYSIGNLELGQYSQSSFEDVTNTEEIPYIETAYRNGVINGLNGKFYPEQPITKEQAVIVLVKAMGEQMAAQSMTEDIFQQSVLYTDKEDISQWAQPFITYAVQKGILTEKEGIFKPQDFLTSSEADTLVENAGKIFQTTLTREGLSARKMLNEASEKMNQYNTYKYTTDMKIKTAMTSTMEGQQTTEETDMVMVQEGIFEKPMKTYGKTVSKVIGKNVTQEQTSEVLLDNGVMYMKIQGADKWAKIDMNPMMQELQKLQGNNAMGSVGLNSEQMELYGMYASFGQDVTVEGKDYYVVNVDLDNEAFNRIVKEIMGKFMDGFIDALKGEKSDVDQEEANQVLQNTFTQFLDQMTQKVNYKFYINKESKIVESFDIHQAIEMNINDMEGAPIQIVSKSSSVGTYKYFDFGVPVTFPTINPEDVGDFQEILQQTSQSE